MEREREEQGRRLVLGSIAGELGGQSERGGDQRDVALRFETVAVDDKVVRSEHDREGWKRHQRRCCKGWRSASKAANRRSKSSPNRRPSSASRSICAASAGGSVSTNATKSSKYSWSARDSSSERFGRTAAALLGRLIVAECTTGRRAACPLLCDFESRR